MERDNEADVPKCFRVARVIAYAKIRVCQSITTEIYSLLDKYDRVFDWSACVEPNPLSRDTGGTELERFLKGGIDEIFLRGEAGRLISHVEDGHILPD